MAKTPLSQEEHDKAIEECSTMELKTLTKEKPHKSWKGWLNFLKSQNLRKKNKNFFWFSNTNCHYLVIRYAPYKGLILDPIGYPAFLIYSFGRRKIKEIIKKANEHISELFVLNEILKKENSFDFICFGKNTLKENAFNGKYIDFNKLI